jgi:sulfatase maturation enzyme AslB (radical SAM superfamily)
MCYGGCQKDRRCAGSYELPTPFCIAYKKFLKHASPKLKSLVKRVERMRNRS